MQTKHKLGGTPQQVNPPSILKIS